MVYSVNKPAQDVLEKMARMHRIKDLNLKYSNGWHETADRKRGLFDVSWQHPSTWKDVILKGPHLGISTPLNKQPNPTMKNNSDWTEVDLEAIPTDFIPATEYFPNRDSSYRTDYGSWTVNGKDMFAIDEYRLAWRCMAATTGYRTLYPAIIPPGSAHIHGVGSAGLPGDLSTLAYIGGHLSSFLTDFMVRSAGLSHIHGANIDSLPVGFLGVSQIARLYLRLNCLTNAYAPLWKEVMGEAWTSETPIRLARERWHAQNEIDAIVALSFGITLDELLMVYNTQFPVMRRYDREDLYDANGRKVPSDIVKLQRTLGEEEELTEEQRTWVHPQSQREYTFQYPFAPLDREADLRDFYEKYSRGVDSLE